VAHATIFIILPTDGFEISKIQRKRQKQKNKLQELIFDLSLSFYTELSIKLTLNARREEDYSKED